MNFGGSAPAGQPVPELPDTIFLSLLAPREPPQATGHSVAYSRRLWEHRGPLARVTDSNSAEEGTIFL